MHSQCMPEMYNESLKATGDEPLTRWQWHELWRTRRIVEDFGKRLEKTQVRARNVGIFCQERVRAKRFSRGGRRKASKECWVSSWNRQSGEYLEPVKCCNDADCTHRMMKRGFFALKSGEWEEYKITFRTEVKATGWAFVRMKEAFEQVAKDEARKLSTVQETMIRSTD